MMHPTAKGLKHVKMACCQLLLSWKIVMRMKLSSPTLNNNLILSRIQTLPHGYKIILIKVDSNVAVSPRASKSLHTTACAQSVASIQDAL
eukprot:15344625-Ditylum_brightwellii.AAC.1